MPTLARRGPRNLPPLAGYEAWASMVRPFGRHHFRRPGRRDRRPRLDIAREPPCPRGDPFRRIVAATKALRVAEVELREAVEAARGAGDSWTVMGAARGTT
jgi:hypothetical protein